MLDRFLNLPALEVAAVFALNLGGREAFSGARPSTLSSSRAAPVSSPWPTSSKPGASPASTQTAAQSSSPASRRAPSPPRRCSSPKGEPSRNVFVVKSGLLGVWLEKPSGGSWMVRSLLSRGMAPRRVERARWPRTCAARRRSLRRALPSEVWLILPAEKVRAVMGGSISPSVSGSPSTGQIHRIDSFFSMHETMGQSTCRSGTTSFSCIQRLESVRRGDHPPPGRGKHGDGVPRRTWLAGYLRRRRQRYAGGGRGARFVLRAPRRHPSASRRASPPSPAPARRWRSSTPSASRSSASGAPSRSSPCSNDSAESTGFRTSQARRNRANFVRNGYGRGVSMNYRKNSPQAQRFRRETPNGVRTTRPGSASRWPRPREPQARDRRSLRRRGNDAYLAASWSIRRPRSSWSRAAIPAAPTASTTSPPASCAR